MKITKATPDPLVCPLCGNPNSCLNLGVLDVTKSCWCNDPNLSFPEELLAKIPAKQRRKACVCKACVLKYHADKETEK